MPPTGFYRDNINLTAAQIGGKVSGDLDATGCDIGVYYGPGTKGSVKKATIENAKYFGVVNYRGKVDVKDSAISKIGNTPFDGSQHGVGILYTTEKDPYGETSGTAEGTISGNILSSYQKNGIVVRGAGASAKIESNTVTGAGHVAYIAQNGIQVSFGGSATVTGNTVSATLVHAGCHRSLRPALLPGGRGQGDGEREPDGEGDGEADAEGEQAFRQRAEYLHRRLTVRRDNDAQGRPAPAGLLRVVTYADAFLQCPGPGASGVRGEGRARVDQ